MEKSAISKVEARKRVLEWRKGLEAERSADWDAQIKERLIGLDPLRREHSDTVYCYISVRGETGTDELIRHFLERGFRVAVPRVRGKDMDFYYIERPEDLEPGGFGIPEPKHSCEKAECKSAPVVVPGVVFSERFERVGYGAGFYDRFFEREPEHEKIAICYDFQLVGAIAADEYDVSMDYVITPSKSLYRKES